MMNFRRFLFQQPLALVTFAVIVCLPLIAACGTAENLQAGQASKETSGQILFVADGDVMLWRDGNVSRVTDVGNAESPTWSPAGDRFAYVQNHGDFSDVVIADRDGDPLVQLTSSDSGLAPYTEDHVFLAAWAREPDWSPVGEELVYISDKGGLDSFSRNMYVWIAEFGVGAAPYALPASLSVALSQEGPVYSPDGRLLAFSVREDQGSGVRYQEVWTLDLEAGFFEPLVVDTDGAFDPDWAPDGEDIVYVQREGENTNLWIAPLSGGEPYRLIGTESAVEPVWSPNGDQIAFIHVVDVTLEVWVVDVERSASGNYSAGEPRRLFTADTIDSTSGLSWFVAN